MGVAPRRREKAGGHAVVSQPAALQPRLGDVQAQATRPHHPGLDTQIAPQHADKLGELARARKKDAGPVEVVHLPGVNHLLVPATTGEVKEYGELKQPTISPEVASTITAWLKKSQP